MTGPRYFTSFSWQRSAPAKHPPERGRKKEAKIGVDVDARGLGDREMDR